jgi:hypothetical protein
MNKKTISLCLASLLLSHIALADEIEVNFMAGYQMGFFMGIASEHPEKVCGNISFGFMVPVIREYVSSHAPGYPLHNDEVLNLQAKYFPCLQKQPDQEYRINWLNSGG